MSLFLSTKTKRLSTAEPVLSMATSMTSTWPTDNTTAAYFSQQQHVCDNKKQQQQIVTRNNNHVSEKQAR